MHVHIFSLALALQVVACVPASHQDAVSHSSSGSAAMTLHDVPPAFRDLHLSPGQIASIRAIEQKFAEHRITGPEHGQELLDVLTPAQRQELWGRMHSRPYGAPTP